MPPLRPVPPRPQSDDHPDVIVDVDVRDGLFSIVLRNIGRQPALDVRTTFDVPLTGLGGLKDVAALTVFRQVPFMAPDKCFTQFVDPLHAYASRGAALAFTATVRWRDREGRAYEQAMAHDLRLYLELGQARVATTTRDT